MIDWDAYWSHDARYRQPAMLHSEWRGQLPSLTTVANQHGGNTLQPVAGSNGSMQSIHGSYAAAAALAIHQSPTVA
jgi:hypothetical protein